MKPEPGAKSTVSDESIFFDMVPTLNPIVVGSDFVPELTRLAYFFPLRFPTIVFFRTPCVRLFQLSLLLSFLEGETRPVVPLHTRHVSVGWVVNHMHEQ